MRRAGVWKVEPEFYAAEVEPSGKMGAVVDVGA